MCTKPDYDRLLHGFKLTTSGTSSNVFRIVFSRRLYAAIAASSAVLLWTVFNILDGLILLSPVLTFYLPIPDDAQFGFVLSIVTATLAGIVISMNVFLFNAGLKVGKASFLSGSTLGTISSMCASCSSVGFYAASTFGVAGVAASSFLSNYQTPLRIAAIAILIVACFAAQRRIGKACRIAT
jgi:hypothetical protein